MTDAFTPDERKDAVRDLQQASDNYLNRRPFPVEETLFNTAELLLDANERIEMQDVGLSALNDAYQALRTDHNLLRPRMVAAEEKIEGLGQQADQLQRQVDQAWLSENEAMMRMRSLAEGEGRLITDLNQTRENLSDGLKRISQLHQLVLGQAGLILELTARLVLLETSGVWPGMPVECREHRCDYYNGYLAQGPAELLHEGYHAAERQYQHRTAQWEQHMDTCQHCKTHFGDCPVAKRMQDGLHEWEKRLRA